MWTCPRHCVTYLTLNSTALDEVSSWFEPLLLHHHILRLSHRWGDKTEPMSTNLRKDPGIIESEKIEEAVSLVKRTHVLRSIHWLLASGKHLRLRSTDVMIGWEYDQAEEIDTARWC